MSVYLFVRGGGDDVADVDYPNHKKYPEFLVQNSEGGYIFYMGLKF